MTKKLIWKLTMLALIGVALAVVFHSGILEGVANKGVPADFTGMLVAVKQGCDPCKAMKNTLAALKTKYSGNILIFDITKQNKTGVKINHTPSIMLYQRGKKKSEYTSADRSLPALSAVIDDNAASST